MAENTDEQTNDLGETDEQFLIDLSARLSVPQAERLDPRFAAALCSIDEASYNDIAPVPLSSDKAVDTQRVIDVMDHFLSCEATWLGGEDSEETVFSCIYFRDPSRLSTHALLYSFFGVARMTYDAVSSVLLFENLENDEEFSDGVSLQMLQGVEEKISHQLKACKALLLEKRLFEGTGVEPLQTNPNPEEKFCHAVLCRLRFRKYFYHMLTCLRRTHGEGLDLGKKHIDSCLNELDSMLKSEEYLRSLTASEDIVEHKKTTASGSQPLGFDYLLHRYTVQPRSWKEAIAYFQKLLHDLKIICSHSFTPVLEDAFSFVVDFHKFQPLPFARAFIQLMVQDGRLYGREPIFLIIRTATLPPKWANEHDIQKLNSVEELGKLLIELLRVLCTDFDSQRSELVSVRRDWRRILQQLYTDLVDKYGDRTRFSHDEYRINKQVCTHILLWVEEQELWIASRYLLLGFETDAYSPNDYCMIYWYIYVIISILKDKIMSKTSMKNESIKRKVRTRKGGSANNMEEESKVPPQAMLLMCYICVIEGLIMILSVLRTKHKLFLDQNEEQRFCLNFSVFKEGEGYWQNLSYEIFKKYTSPSRFPDAELAVFDEADKIVRQLRVEYGNDAVRLTEVEQLQNVAARNQVTFNLLRRLGTLDESTTFSFEFDQHPHFAVVTMDSPDLSKSLQQLNMNAP